MKTPKRIVESSKNAERQKTIGLQSVSEKEPFQIIVYLGAFLFIENDLLRMPTPVLRAF